ncbi:uncharacterized protein LOC110008149 isoform X2 [Amborella trichopoda]|uniref:uncharacterized protein LOC110008149 isoform X2 n=1 Tax=Amborella trichopoda TaxID=13333 RepID=UPI0009BCC9C1|nr:uncharacterized protein LOC110008149 isoform X2 [Amborella trichopoda]|eukprot:XP_020529480.1 uncharacterized protein LOC110008149 isoform X2 [Amborella trichopoda]
MALLPHRKHPRVINLLKKQDRARKTIGEGHTSHGLYLVDLHNKDLTARQNVNDGLDDDVVETGLASFKATRMQWLKRMEIEHYWMSWSKRLWRPTKLQKDFKSQQWAPIEQEFLKATSMDVKKDNFKNTLKT